MKKSISAVCFLSCALLGTGCASVSVQSNALLGSSHYSPSDALAVRILEKAPNAAPGREPERLGRIFLDVQGHPPRERLEKRLRREAAKLGANAVYVVSDQLHVFPQVFSDFWWGPTETFEETSRAIVAIAVRLPKPQS